MPGSLKVYHKIALMNCGLRKLMVGELGFVKVFGGKEKLGKIKKIEDF